MQLEESENVFLLPFLRLVNQPGERLGRSSSALATPADQGR